MPADRGVAAGHPLAGLGGHGGFGGVVAGDVGEGGGRLEKFAALELRLSHEEPGVLEEGVELAPLAVELLLGRHLSRGACLRLALYGVEGYGLAALGDGRFEVGLARLPRLLAADEEDREEFGEVVLVTGEFGIFPFEKSLLAVEVGVVAGREGMPTPRSRRVLPCGTGGGQQQEGEEAGKGQYEAAGVQRLICLYKEENLKRSVLLCAPGRKLRFR